MQNSPNEKNEIDFPERGCLSHFYCKDVYKRQIMGYTAANLLMTRIEEPLLNYRTVYTETNLILRESTGD